ncbi:MAG: MerR family DNA-binding protein, partial [Rhodospirillaceae bacterium]
AARRANGYRDYAPHDVHTLSFLNRARSLGFTVDDCRALIALYTDRDRKSADVKALALTRIEDIDRKISELRSMRRTLEHLAEQCHGDERPDCPILDDLAGEEKA